MILKFDFVKNYNFTSSKILIQPNKTLETSDNRKVDAAASTEKNKDMYRSVTITNFVLILVIKDKKIFTYTLLEYEYKEDNYIVESQAFRIDETCIIRGVYK